MSIQSILSLAPRVGSPKVRFILADRAAPGFRRITMNDEAFNKAIPTNDRVAAQADLMAQASAFLPPGSQMSTYYVDAKQVQHAGFSINIPLEGGGGGTTPMMDVNARLEAAASKFLAAGGDPAALATIQPTAIGIALIEAMTAKLGTSAPAQNPAEDGDVPF